MSLQKLFQLPSLRHAMGVTLRRNISAAHGSHNPTTDKPNHAKDEANIGTSAVNRAKDEANIGTSAVNRAKDESKPAEKKLDSIARLFLEKIREYRQKSEAQGGGVVDADEAYYKKLAVETMHLQKQFGLYGKGDPTKFPEFKWHEPEFDPISKDPSTWGPRDPKDFPETWKTAISESGQSLDNFRVKEKKTSVK